MFEVDFHGLTFTQALFDDMSDEAKWYLISNGWKQSIGDCTAGLAKKLRDEGKTETEVSAALAEAEEERFGASLAGEVSSRSTGPRRRGIDKIVDEVAQEILKAAFGKQGRKWPSGKGSAEAIAKLVEALLAKRGKAIRDEAERRMALVGIEDDLDF